MDTKEKAIKESTKVIYHAKVICPIESRVEEDVIVGTRKDALDILKEFRDTGEYEEEYYEFDIEEENITNTSKALDIAIKETLSEVISMLKVWNCQNNPETKTTINTIIMRVEALTQSTKNKEVEDGKI